MEGALRVSDGGRDRVVARLRRACAQGEIGVDTFEARLDATLRARTVHELRRITRDLPTMRDRIEARVRELAGGRDAPPPPLAVPEADEVVIGRSRSCDVVLEADSISRRHALIRRVGDRWRLTDLASTNGTYVNGVAIEMGFIEPGDRITLGGITLTFAPPA